MKTLEEFVSFAECFPSALADTIGNGWTTQDVVDLVEEIRAAAGISSLCWPTPPSGALDPKKLP